MWLSPRAGTDGDLFGAMLRYILENDNQNDPNKNTSTGALRNTPQAGKTLRLHLSRGGGRKILSTA